MSRHDLEAKPGSEGVVRATIGWDRPLQTFFAQVFFTTEDEPVEGEALIWLGTEPGEFLTAEAAIAIVAPHAIVPADLADQLTADMRATAGVADGQHQAAAKRRLFGTVH